MGDNSICFAILLFCASSCTQSVTIEGGCNRSPTTLTEGPNKLNNSVPVLQAATDTFQPLLGGEKINGWTVLRGPGVQMHGLWCQVNPSVSFNMLNNSSNWYISTGFNTLELALTSRSPTFPYELFQCSNQTGVAPVSGSLDRFQGIVKCNTTAPMLTTPSEVYLSVYTNQVFDSYSGPSIQSIMELNVISPRDENVLNITLSFNVSFGLPSRVTCTDQLRLQGTPVLLDAREAPNLSREVLQTHYFNSSVADITRVTVTLNNVTKLVQFFACNVTVEGYRSSGALITMGTGRSIIGILVSSAPVNVTVTQVANSNSAIVQWSAPLQAPSLYEVFYRSQSDSQSTSGGIVSTLQTTLTGLQSGVQYTFYVVSFRQNTNLFPSQRSNEVTLLLVAPSSTVVTPSVSETTTIIQFATASTYQSTVTPLATLTDIRPTVEDPVVLIVSLMIVGWSLFFITLLLLVVTLIVCFCKRRHHKKNSSISLASTTVSMQDEELYDNIDQLDQNNDQEMTNNSSDEQDQITRNNTSVTDSNGVQINTDESNAVVYDNDIGTIYNSIKTCHEDDITMTECIAYGTNHQPQSDYDEIVNNTPCDQQPQITDYDDYI